MSKPRSAGSRFGDAFFTYPCDFINLTFCPGPAGNLVGDCIYNWPVSQWAAVARVNFGSEGYAKAGIFDSNTDYLSTKPNPALWPTFPDDSQGVIRPAEVAWTPKFNGLAGTYRIGGWWNSSAAPNVATSIDGEPILVSGPPGVPGHGRYGFFTVLQQQLARDPANPDPKNGLNAFFARDLRGSPHVHQGRPDLRGNRCNMASVPGDPRTDMGSPSARRTLIRMSPTDRSWPTSWASVQASCSAMNM